MITAIIELFIGFFYVGCFSFGGAYGAIPLIRDVVVSFGWITDEKLSYMIAVSESTPGPIMINLATYVGSEKAGIVGSLVATFAVALPSFIIIVLITKALSKAVQNKYFNASLVGLKPAIVGVIIATGIYMIFSNILGSIGNITIDYKGVIVLVILIGLLAMSKFIFKKKISAIGLIGISALVGVLVYEVAPMLIKV